MPSFAASVVKASATPVSLRGAPSITTVPAPASVGTDSTPPFMSYSPQLFGRYDPTTGETTLYAESRFYKNISSLCYSGGGYSSCSIDIPNHRIFAVVNCGEKPGYMEWAYFDMNTCTWSEMHSVKLDYRYCYTFIVPEGPRYTLRDLLIAEGEIDGGADKVDAALLEAEMTAVPHETMVAQGGLVERIAGDLEAIAEAISEKTAQKASASFETLQNELKTLRRFYAKFVHSAVQPASDEIAGDAPPAGGMSLQARALDPSQVQARNRSEALMLLKKGCDYFRTSEPTSPVPFLVERALRMAEMNFMDLLAEIDPNGVERGRDILGVKPAANG